MAATTTPNRTDRNAGESFDRGTQQTCNPQLHVLNDLQCYTKNYIQQQPETAALICLGIGFLLGWKLKPW